MWLQFFNRPGSPERAQVDELIARKVAATTGVVVAEILQGARSQEHLRELEDMMRGLPFLDTTRAVWEIVGELAFTLRSKGESLPIPDLAIGAVAIEYRCQLFTRDEDFRRIPGLQLYSPIQ